MVFARYNREKTHPRVRFLFYSLTAMFSPTCACNKLTVYIGKNPFVL